MKYLLDTNVFGEAGKSTPHQNVERWMNSIDDSDFGISALTVREVAKGVAKLRQREPQKANEIAHRVNKLFQVLDDRILPVDRAIAELWGEILAVREKHVSDTGIAATARIHKLVVVTRNTGDFVTLGVKILNPFKSPPEIIL